MTTASFHDLARRWPALLLFAVVALLPFGRLSGLPMLVMVVLGLVSLARRPAALCNTPPARLLLALYACYALPLVIASIDAVHPEKSWTTALASLRFAVVGLFAVHHLASREQRMSLWRWTTWLVLAWAGDALVQFMVGFNLLGMPLSEDRLNGIFGATDIKLGPVLAVLSPLALEFARRNWSRRSLVVSYALLMAVILLTGTRAAWIMFALVTACYLYLYARHHPGRWARSLAWVAVLVTGVGVGGYQLSDNFQQRVDRSLLLLSGDSGSVNQALSRRLEIWTTAIDMAAAHPINGVGPRGFRYAYPEHADGDDPWLHPERGTGAAHAHQLLLEVATETGIIGLVAMVLAALLALRAWRGWPPPARLSALPFAIALGAMLFPLNTHMAFYSTFYALLFWWLVSLFCAYGRGVR